MEMQDNEFDELFRSKLDGFETAPSANVWAGVTAGLSDRKRKKIFGPFLSIAASIIILVAAGILFIPQKGNLSVKHTKGKTVENRLLPGSTGQIKSRSTLVISNSKNVAMLKAATVNKTTLPHTPKGTKSTQVIKDSIAEAGKPVKNDDRSLLASIYQKQPDTIKAAVPDKETQIAVKLPVEERPSFITKPALSGIQLPVSDKQDAALMKANHKIRSFGDLINVAVAKIDKRKDKIIEFTDDDDDESTLTGINLGIIKIKKGK